MGGLWDIIKANYTPPPASGAVINLPVKPKPVIKAVRGVDISHHNESVDFKALALGDWPFAYLKATEGTTFVDPTFKARWQDAKSAGILRGAYHFFHSNIDPMVQAQHFLSVVQPQIGDLPCCLDWEVTDGVDAALMRSNALIWLQAVENASGKTPLIYASPSFITDKAKLTEAFNRYPLWIAEWSVSSPRVPAPWTNYAFWQDSDAAKDPGIAGTTDTDFFNGSLDELKKLAEG